MQHIHPGHSDQHGRAGKVTAIDIDDWCVNNSRDNIALNGISNITVELGDASLLNGREPLMW